MAKATKRTKKFSKNHLDRTIKDRKDRQKKSAGFNKRHGKGANGVPVRKGPAISAPSGGAESEGDAESDDEVTGARPQERATVDDFLGSSIRALGDDDEDDEEDEDGSGGGSDSEDEEDDLHDLESLSDDDEEGHAQDLAKLAEKDPEFFKYLQENDRELLKFGDEGSDADGEAADSVDEKGKGKTSASKSQPVTRELLKGWQKSILQTHSLRALRRLLLAFRAAAHMGAEDAGDQTYHVNEAAVFNKIIMTSLKYVPVVLQHHIPAKGLPSGKFKVPTNSKKYAALQKPIQSFFSSLHRLLRTLPEPKLLYVCVNESSKMVPYMIQKRRIAREHIKLLLELWATSEENVRIAAFLAVRTAAAAGDETLLNTSLRGAYRHLVRSAKSTTVHTISNINLMKNSASELYALNLDTSYQQAFGYIRQLAIHLRACLKNKTQESYQAVYNWQYVHCLDFWAIVLSTACDKERVQEQGHESPMQPLIYPLVQAATGAVRLVPTSRYFPMRLHVVQSLLRLMQRTGTYIPLASLLLEMLEAPEFTHKAKPSTLTALNLDVLIRLPKNYARTKVYSDQLIDEISFFLLEFLQSQARSIAFPELAIPILAHLRRTIKVSKSQRDAGHAKVVQVLRNLVDKIERHAHYIRSQRSQVDFAPRDEVDVGKFLSNVSTELPIEATARLARKVRRDKQALLQLSQVQVDGDEATESDEADDIMDEDDED